MSNVLNIINLLAGKTHTLGWDAVVAYDRQKVNHLLQQQYVSKLGTGTHFPPITWENKNKTIRFENLILGAPLVSFENATTENSRVSADLEFIGGNVIEKNSNNQVINYVRIRPGTGFKMKLSIDLTAGKGSVDENGKVLVDFSQGNILNIDLALTNELLAEVKEYFIRWFRDNPIIYELGKLLLKDLNTKLTPKKFIIRTQCAPGANLLYASNYGNGAVLLFIATEYNPDGGSLPTNNYLWLIPEGNSSTILINNRIVIEHYIKPSLDKTLTRGEWKMVRGTGGNDAFYLKASDNASVDTSSFVFKKDSDMIWSGTYTRSGIALEKPVYEKFNYSFKGAKLYSNLRSMEIGLDKSNQFIRNISDRIYAKGVPDPITFCTYEVTFHMDGKVTYGISVNKEDKSIHFALKENNAVIASNLEKFLEPAKWVLGSGIQDKIEDFIKNIQAILSGISFNDVSVFAIDKVLFPEQNINQLESAYLPGDLAVFGNIAPALTSLTLSPLTSTISVGDNITFTTNTKDKVTYTLSPKGAGHVTAEGVYYAPDSIREGTLNVTVKATTTKGSASAHLTVISSPILLSPSFIVLQEDNLHTIQFNAKVLGQNGAPTWALISSDPDVVGTIDRNGLYIPPILDKSKEYPLGYTYVTVSATSSDGKISRAYIMLVSKKTQPEFKVLPPFVSVSSQITQTFTAKESLDFFPDTWTHYPALGTLSKPEEKKGVYSVNYTAPDKLTGDELVIIRAIQKNKAHRAGYSIIDLTSAIQSTYDKETIK